MRVVGVDLSLTSTGIAFANGETRTIKVPADGMARLSSIRSHLMAYVEVFGADLVVIEGYSYGSPNRAAHLGELGGVIRLALYERRVRYVDVPPAVLKKYATGKGNAGKNEMLTEAVRRLGYTGSSDDEADALWLRAAALEHYGEPVAAMPQENVKALAKVSWPTFGAVDAA